nr:MAG TPA: Rtr1/RPAP2 family [Caudoviricetes sp.]
MGYPRCPNAIIIIVIGSTTGLLRVDFGEQQI